MYLCYFVTNYTYLTVYLTGTKDVIFLKSVFLLADLFFSSQIY